MILHSARKGYVKTINNQSKTTTLSQGVTFLCSWNSSETQPLCAWYDPALWLSWLRNAASAASAMLTLCRGFCCVSGVNVQKLNLKSVPTSVCPQRQILLLTSNQFKRPRATVWIFPVGAVFGYSPPAEALTGDSFLIKDYFNAATTSKVWRNTPAAAAVVVITLRQSGNDVISSHGEGGTIIVLLPLSTRRCQNTNSEKKSSPRVRVAPPRLIYIIKNDKSLVASICDASLLRPFGNTMRHGGGALAHHRED